MLKRLRRCDPRGREKKKNTVVTNNQGKRMIFKVLKNVKQ